MYRITLKSHSAFFRNDATMSSYQECLPVPSFATIYGLIAAAAGEYRYDVDIGYICIYQAKPVDYELIMTKNKKKKNLYHFMRQHMDRYDRDDILRGCNGTTPIKREILINCTLYIYLSNEEIARKFIKPYYALLLGRTEDIAKVTEVKEIDLIKEHKRVRLGNTILPFHEKFSHIPGRIASMNIAISETEPRQVIQSGVFCIVELGDRKIENKYNLFLYDEEIDYGVYLHERPDKCF